MKQFNFWTLLFIINILFFTSCQQEDMISTQEDPKTSAEINTFIQDGTWQSIKTELRPVATPNGILPQYLKRQFEYFEGKTFKGTLTNYTDIQGTLPSLELQFEGHYYFKGVDGLIEHAYKIDYVIDRSFKVTPKSQDMVNQLNATANGVGTWNLGETKEVLGEDLPSFGLIAGQNAVDYDLIYIKAGKLFMGAKPVDGQGTATEGRRPMGVLQVPLVREVKQADATTLEELKAKIRGHNWVSIANELRPGLGANGVEASYTTRVFKYFENDLFEGENIYYADAARQIPLYRIDFKGSNEWEGADPIIPEAQKINYLLDRSFIITPLNQGFADLLNSSPSPDIDTWQVNVAQELVGKAFPLFGIQAGEFFKDHDLVYLYDDQLFFGAKHVDGSSFTANNRPTGLLQIPLIKE